MTERTYLSYRDLPVIEATGDHHAWNCFGERDELGTMNFIGPEQVRAGMQCASEGRVVNLTLPLALGVASAYGPGHSRISFGRITLGLSSAILVAVAGSPMSTIPPIALPTTPMPTQTA